MVLVHLIVEFPGQLGKKKGERDRFVKLHLLWRDKVVLYWKREGKSER